MTAHRPHLRIVVDQTEKVYGSPQFIGIGRNTGLRSPVKFEPTVKREGDVVL